MYSLQGQDTEQDDISQPDFFFLRKGRREIITCHTSGVRCLQYDGGTPANFKGQLAETSAYLPVQQTIASAHYQYSGKGALREYLYSLILLKNYKPRSNNQQMGSAERSKLWSGSSQQSQPTSEWQGLTRPSVLLKIFKKYKKKGKSLTFYPSPFCTFRPQLHEKQGITMHFMEKSLLFVALHMKAYPRLLDVHLRPRVKGTAHVTLFEEFQMQNHPQKFFDLTWLGRSSTFSTLSCGSSTRWALSAPLKACGKGKEEAGVSTSHTAIC